MDEKPKPLPWKTAKALHREYGFPWYERTWVVVMARRFWKGLKAFCQALAGGEGE